mmetsp:Transcript_45181/g.130864  ORF Transcript_45181/g.130864 Transcript_45181/m.130864 type:complete len:229 (+) Transcript_45181:176-862(+)
MPDKSRPSTCTPSGSTRPFRCIGLGAYRRRLQHHGSNTALIEVEPYPAPQHSLGSGVVDQCNHLRQADEHCPASEVACKAAAQRCRGHAPTSDPGASGAFVRGTGSLSSVSSVEATCHTRVRLGAPLHAGHLYPHSHRCQHLRVPCHTPRQARRQLTTDEQAYQQGKCPAVRDTAGEEQADQQGQPLAVHDVSGNLEAGLHHVPADVDARDNPEAHWGRSEVQPGPAH